MPNKGQLVLAKPKRNKPKRPPRRKIKGQQRRRQATVQRIRGGSNPRNANADLQSFKRALLDPFNPLSVGAKVCDAWSIPTVAYHVRGNIVCTNNASGVFAMMVMPSPCFTTLLQGAGAAGTISGNFSPFAQNTYAGYAISPSDLSNVLTEYRTVSWGLRLIPKNTATNSKGRYTIALVPTTRNAPSWNTLATVTATNAGIISEYSSGYDISKTTTQAQALNLPSVRVFSAQDLLRGEIQVNPIPCHQAFWEFKGTADRSNLTWAADTVMADEIVFDSTTLGAVNSTSGGRKDVASLAGGVAVILSLTGGVASANDFDVEFIYHLEGTPNISGSNAGVLVPSSMSAVRGSTSLIESVLSTVSMAVDAVKYIQNPMFGATNALNFAVHALAPPPPRARIM